MTTFTVTNTNDSGAGSLRQAILDSNAAGGSNTIEFNASLTGQTITALSEMAVTVDTVIDGDGTDDITIMVDQDTSLFTLDIDGITLETSVTIDFDIDDTLVPFFPSTRGAITVDAENAEIINRGDISVAGVNTLDETIGFSNDRISAIDAFGANFTFMNLGSDSSIVSAGRFAVQQILGFDFDDDGNFLGFTNGTANIVNEGLLESGDDPLRLLNGTVTNSGTIRSTGEFGFSEFSTPGLASDGIVFLGPDIDGISEANVTNTASGLIEGIRSGISQVTTLDNAGTITGQVTGVWTQRDSDFIIDNSGSIIRQGENFGFGDDGEITSSAILVGVNVDNSIITNSGMILSTDLAISAGAGTTLTNEVTGIIDSDTDGIDADGIGEDGLAFRGARMDDFLVEAFISFPGPQPGDVYENTQGITVDANGEFVIPGIGTFPAQFGQIEAAFVGADNPILPLVDIAATQTNGFLTFETDGNGTVYPATIDVTSSTLGVLTVTFVSGSGFTITDASGGPVFDVPSDVDFDDTITNDGLIEGDITTGLGNDVVTNTGVIDGDISLGAGNDIFNGGSDDDFVVGGAGNDNLSGAAGNDTLNGDDGNDIIDGGNGTDIIDGGSGDDTLRGNGGVDTIDGGTGIDTISAGVGNDTVSGGGNNDTILGQGGADMLFGDGGADTLRGGSGNDTLFGGDAADMLFGQGNNDILYGESGNDTLSGAAGSDQLFGGTGDDTLLGSVGADRLDGGTGDDVLNGGNMDGARDTFVFAVGYDEDRINSFDQAGTDRLELDEGLWASAGTLTAQQVVDMFGSLNATGTILTLDFGNGDILEVQSSAGIDADTLGADIVFI